MPAPGLLLEIGARLDIDLKGVPMAGDALRDMQAAAGVGCKPYLVLTGKGRKTRDEGGLPPGTEVVADLAALAARLAP